MEYQEPPISSPTITNPKEYAATVDLNQGFLDNAFATFWGDGGEGRAFRLRDFLQAINDIRNHGSR